MGNTAMQDDYTQIHKECLDKLERVLEKHLDDPALDADVSRALRESLGALFSHSTEVTRALVERLGDERAALRDRSAGKWDTIWEIATALVPKGRERKVSGFVPVLQDESTDNGSPWLPGGPFFLRCAYADLEGYYGKTCTGRLDGQPVTYELRPNYRFLREEKMLFDTTQLYGLRRPVIFSPWSRRAVDIRLLQMPDHPKGKLEIDLDLGANGLDGVLVRDHSLMWNVVISARDFATSTKAPWQDDRKYSHRYSDAMKGTVFILPELPDDGSTRLEQLDVHKEEKEIIVRCACEFPQAHRRVEIFPLDHTQLPGEYAMFRNACHVEEILGRERLRTAGDINMALAALRLDGFSAEFSDIGAEGNTASVVWRYRGEHRYPVRQADSLYVAQRPLPLCRVRFDGDDIFVSDYAEYVLHYLERRYPEYLWVGVR